MIEFLICGYSISIKYYGFNKFCCHINKAAHSNFSTWSLVEELKKLQSDETNKNYLSSLASLTLTNYTFPVQMLVHLSNGTVVK